MAILFKALCGCLYALGLLCGLTYQEISVYVCIYACPVICMLCSSVVPLLTIRLFSFFGKMWIPFNLIVTYVYYITARSFWRHYRGSVPEQFTQCYNDLTEIARRMNMTYEEVNIYIYVYLFFGIIAFHTTPSIIAILYRSHKKRKSKKNEINKGNSMECN